MHLLEPHARSTLCTYSYDYIVNYSPSVNSLMIITGSMRKQSKIILNTNQAFQIATLIRDYSEALRPVSGYQSQNCHQATVAGPAQQQQQHAQSRAVPVHVSILHKPSPNIVDDDDLNANAEHA